MNKNEKHDLKFYSPKFVSIMTIIIMIISLLYIIIAKSQTYKKINILWLGFMFGLAFPIYYNIYIIS